MNSVYGVITERLQSKKDELSRRQEQFRAIWNMEKTSGCYERNAINDLLIMQQLKVQIEELEFLEVITRAERQE